MASVLHVHTQEEQHKVVCFLWTQGLSTDEVNKEVLKVYYEKRMSRKAIYNWIQKLNNV